VTSVVRSCHYNSRCAPSAPATHSTVGLWSFPVVSGTHPPLRLLPLCTYIEISWYDGKGRYRKAQDSSVASTSR
jgi:hypothetical protein